MLNRSKHLETTRIEILSDGTTKTARDDAAEIWSAPKSLETDQLCIKYEAILREQAIYYPVAYRLVRELGRGRQGVVFQGLRQGARGCITRHAIKIFDPSIYSSATSYWTDMGRIAAQISRLQTVRSPNLVARDAYEETNGIGYVQMEAIDGVDLRYLLRGKHLEQVRNRCTPSEWSRFTDVIFRVENGKVSIQPGVALYIMRQVLRGLETLHEMDFVHSDIKPANVMIDRLGYVKLVDYGRASRANEQMTVLFGSPLYMAPETHRRESTMVQSDLYSVGLVLLELLRGEPLVNATNLTETDLLNFKMDLPSKLPELLPDHVRTNDPFVHLIRRFVEPKPELRFHAADDAESGSQGLRLVHKQLVKLGKDTEYGRELQGYLGKLLVSQKDQDAQDLTQI